MNNLLNRLKSPIPVTDRVLEIAAGIIFIAMLVMTAILYNMAPDTVPSHFTFTGHADEWSDKIFLWQTSGLFVIFMVITYISAYYTDRNVVRLPTRKKLMNEYQKALSSRLCRIINIGLAILWCNILLSASSEILGIGETLISVLIFASTALIIIPSIYYTIKIIRQ